MARDQASIGSLLFKLEHLSSPDVLAEMSSLTVELDHLSQLGPIIYHFLDLGLFKIEVGAWTSGEVNHTFICEAASQGPIVPVYLSIGFFNEEDPHLVAIGTTEQRTRIGIAREVIVDCDIDPITVLAEFETIDSLLILILCDEKILYKLRSLSQ